MSLRENAFISYIIESKEELKKVAWPTRQTVIRDTILVVGVSLALAIFFGATDFGLSTGLQRILAV